MIQFVLIGSTVLSVLRVHIALFKLNIFRNSCIPTQWIYPFPSALLAVQTGLEYRVSTIPNSWKVLNGAETNYRIANILGMLMMTSYYLAIYFSNIIVVCAVSICARSDWLLKHKQPSSTHAWTRQNSARIHYCTKLDKMAPISILVWNETKWPQISQPCYSSVPVLEGQCL